MMTPVNLHNRSFDQAHAWRLELALEKPMKWNQLLVMCLGILFLISIPLCAIIGAILSHYGYFSGDNSINFFYVYAGVSAFALLMFFGGGDEKNGSIM